MSNENNPTTEQQQHQSALSQIDAEIAQFATNQVIAALKGELAQTRLKLAGVQAELATIIAANQKRERKAAKKGETV